MTFASRNVVVLAKVEPTPGTYTAPSAGSDAVMIGSNVTYKQNVARLERDRLREVMGGADSLSGFTFDEITFDTELASSGTPGTAPAWGTLMRAAGFAQTVVSGVAVFYTPISESMEALSMSYFFGGVRRNMRGARVRRLAIGLGVNGIPMCTWTIVGAARAGVDNALVPTSAPTPTLTQWKLPRAVLNEFAANNIVLGAALNMGTGAITGGTEQKSKGMSITVENECNARPFLGWGGDNCPITDRDIKVNVSFDLDAATRASFYADLVANTYTSLSQMLGGGAYPGETVKFFMPRTQFIDHETQDDAGLLLSGYTFNVLPNAGNDDLILAAM